MTATTTERNALLQAGSKRIMGVVRNKGITSVEVYELVIRWGRYIDQAEHPVDSCKHCHHLMVWDSFDNCYVHQDSKHKHCSTHSGRVAT